MNQGSGHAVGTTAEPQESEILTRKLRSRLRWILPTLAAVITSISALLISVSTDCLLARILVLPLLLVVGEISPFLLVRDRGGLFCRMIVDILVSLAAVYLVGLAQRDK